MNCSDLITHFLAGYLDGELSAEIRSDFEHHLDLCASCVAYLHTYRETIVLVAASQVADDVPPELIEAVLAVVVPRK